MKTTILTFILTLTSSQAFAISISSITDVALDAAAKFAVEQKINGLYKKAMACKTPEYDEHSSFSIDDLMAIEPEIPSWRMLKDITKIAYEAKSYATKQSGTDKVLHCFAGCYVAQKLDFTSGVIVGWMKELSDASDCSLETHFEKNDYEATMAGAYIGSIPTRTCESFCQRDDIKNLDGDEMLEAAKREMRN